MYVYHTGSYKVRVPTQRAWLEALGLELHNPKPPEWWLEAEALKGRERTQAAIIWSSRYKADRKYVVWAQAPLSDFIALGYYEEA